MCRMITIDNFASRALQNTRSLRIHLPPGYRSNGTKRYPVLYVHDGQNLFSNETAFAGTAWDIHRTADSLIERNLMRDIIIVGIDNTPNRFGEYTYPAAAMDAEQRAQAQGDGYARFLIDEVIPFVDGRFRTLPVPEHRAVMGSSMGGLISLHLALRHPSHFSMAGCLSSAFRWADNYTLAALRRNEFSHGSRPKIWMDLGDAEEAPILETREIALELLRQGWELGKTLGYYEAPGAGHFEVDWARRVHMPLLFFFGAIGDPVEMTLMGSKQAAIAGMAQWINPVVQTDNDVRLTDLTAEIESMDPNTLTVDTLGQLQANHLGTCEVKARSHGFETMARYAIAERMDPMLSVRITVSVPEETPADQPVYVGLVTQPDFLPLEKLDQKTYTVQTQIPRSMKIAFAFTRGTRETMEVVQSSEYGMYRQLAVSEDKAEYRFCVQQWADIPNVM